MARQIVRVKDWRTKLSAHINTMRPEPFVWGKHDCALWAASCVEVMTGVDLAAPVKGKYSTPQGAYKSIKKYYDVDQISELMKKLFGEPIHAANIRPGDIAFVKVNFAGFDYALGICNGAHSFFVTENLNSLAMMDTLQVDGGFRVG